MTEDIDLEALLEAPFRQPEQPSQQPNGNDLAEGLRAAREESKHSRSQSKSPGRHSRSDKHRSRHYHRRGSKSRSRSTSRDKRRGRQQQQQQHHDQRSRSPKRSGSPVLTEAQRDRRTVFVRQLAQRCRSPDLKEFCQKVGRVRDVKIVYDKISHRSKGVAYVEFYDEDSVPKAMDLTGQKLLGIPIIIELTETEKNRLAEEAAEAARRAKVQTAVALNRLYVGSLHPNLGDDELRKVFEPFGDIEFITVNRESDTGRSKGFAFVQYKSAADAKQAMDQMNGFELAGRAIRIGLVKDKAAPTNTIHSGAFASLDDADNVGLNLTAQGRSELMLKLARDSDLVKNIPGMNVNATLARKPSPCVLLQKMYNPEEETELHWEYQIADEVREECAKHGPVLHINVKKNKNGDVYLKFASVPAAEAAVSSLNGRWFGGRQVVAQFVPPEEYRTLFPGA